MAIKPKSIAKEKSKMDKTKKKGRKRGRPKTEDANSKESSPTKLLRRVSARSRLKAQGDEKEKENEKGKGKGKGKRKRKRNDQEEGIGKFEKEKEKEKKKITLSPKKKKLKNSQKETSGNTNVENKKSLKKQKQSKKLSSSLKKQNSSSITDQAIRKKLKKKESNYLVCLNCGLSVKKSTFTLQKYWDDFEDLCEKQYWTQISHRHFVNVMEDLGYSDKNLKAAKKVAAVTLAIPPPKDEKFTCPYDNCTRFFSTFLKLKVHVAKTHAKKKEESRPPDAIVDLTKLNSPSSNQIIHQNKKVVETKVHTEMLRSEDNERTRRGLVPIVPLRNEFLTSSQAFNPSCQSLPKRLTRFGIVNGILSRNAATLRGGETSRSGVNRVQAYYVCPKTAHGFLIHKMDPPFGMLTLPNGTLDLAETQRDLEEGKYPPPPIIPPDPPQTSPEPKWMLKAFDLVKKIQAENQLQELIGSDRSESKLLSKNNQTENAVSEETVYNDVCKAAKALDALVKPGFPSFFSNLRSPTTNNKT